MSKFSRDSLELFSHLLSQVSLPANSPDLVEQAQKIATAQRELAEALSDEQPAEE